MWTELMIRKVLPTKLYSRCMDANGMHDNDDYVWWCSIDDNHNEVADNEEDVKEIIFIWVYNSHKI